MARDFHRYYPTGLGRSRCSLCGGSATDEVHIAGLNQEATGTELVQCPSCTRTVPTDYTVRVFLKDGAGNSKKARLCKDCAQDPEMGKDLAADMKQKDVQTRQIARLMGRLDRGEIDQAAYDSELEKLLS